MQRKEKRCMIRFAASIPVKISRNAECGRKIVSEAIAKNICAGGTFIETSDSFLLGSATDVEIVLTLDRLKKTDVPKVLVKAQATVCRIEKNGVALSFAYDYDILPLPQAKKKELDLEPSI